MVGVQKVIILLYNRLFDPLIQGNFWLYIESYLEDPQSQYEFHLVSYEDQRFPLTEAQRAKVDRWCRLGLKWHQLRWHPGTDLRSKVTDILAGFWAVLQLRMNGARHLLTLASVAGTFGYLYARLLGLRLFLYQFEPHSEYAIDNRMWRPDSLVFRVSHYLERRAAEYAAVIASGTRFMQQRLTGEWRVKAAFFKTPTVANDRKFLFDPAGRVAMRRQLGYTDDLYVLLYPGKFGSLYYTDETAQAFRWLHEMEPRLRLLIVTPHSDDEVHDIFSRNHVSRDAYAVFHSDYADVHRYYWAADFALIAVPPGPSKKFISNIKVGEYLCAGLPYLITRGVSEDYLVALEQQVGVVVDDFREEHIRAAWPAIERYLQMPADARRLHCREVGLAYRGFAALNPVFRAAMDELFSRGQP